MEENRIIYFKTPPSKLFHENGTTGKIDLKNRENLALIFGVKKNLPVPELCFQFFFKNSNSDDEASLE